MTKVAGDAQKYFLRGIKINPTITSVAYGSFGGSTDEFLRAPNIQLTFWKKYTYVVSAILTTVTVTKKVEEKENMKTKQNFYEQCKL